MSAIGILIAVVLLGGAALRTSPPLPRVALTACEVRGVKDALCGTLQVLESPRGSRTITLNIVVLRARSAPPARDAIFALQGGPGQGVTTLTDFYAETFAAERATRDIVLVDQRGTGESNPLNCDMRGDASTMQALLHDLFPVDKVRACRDRLSRGSDLTRYTTDVAVDDLEAVRAALGYERLNLYGTSYGTRVALVYMRRYPQRVRTAILKGPVPMTMIAPVPFAADTQRALGILVDDCEADAACHGAFPELRGEFNNLVDTLSAGPIATSIRNPKTGMDEPVTVSRGVVAATIRSYLQTPQMQARLPLIVHRFATEGPVPLVTAILDARRGGGEGLSYGMSLSVMCAEDVPKISADAVKAQTAGTFMRDYWVQQLQQACAEWPRGVVPADFLAPVTSSIPTLVLSGYLDSATPPRWGEETVRTMAKARHVAVRYAAHNYGGLRPCVDRIMDRFIEAGTVDGLDTACVETIKRPPFVLR